MHFFYDNRRLLAGVLLSAALLSGCAPKNNSQGSDQSSADVSTSENNPGGDVSQPDGSSVTANGSASLPEDGSQQAAYDFSKPCPESPAVDNSYFADAALSVTPVPRA